MPQSVTGSFQDRQIPKSIRLFVCALLLVISATSQQTITGKVISTIGAQPVAGASVFISNTSKGTVTNSAGEFILSEVPAGTHELVVSFVGFDTYVKSFKTSDLPMKLAVSLAMKVKELEGVTVVPVEKDGWVKWGRVFLENFIGNTPNAVNCRIVNYKSIKFRFSKKEDKLMAVAMEPLIIQNRSLGYTIRYQLEGFEVDYKTGAMSYYGYPLFEEMRGGKRKWKNARQKSYLGSVCHFMRTVYENKVAEEGFEVKRLKKIPNFEKERIKGIYKVVEKKKVNPTTGATMLIMEYNFEQFPADTVTYFRKVLNQKDYFDVYSDDLLPADSLVIYDSVRNKYLWFLDYLAITYKNGLEDKKYLEDLRESNRKPFFQRSSLILTGRGYVAIEPNGSYFSPQDLFTNGYWGWHEKVADLLPVDYELNE